MIKFVKNNKVAVISIGAIVISLLLLLVPGFAHYTPFKDGYEAYANGYQFIFNTVTHEGAIASAYGSGIVGAGVAIIVLSALAITSFCFTKKSSFFVLLGGLISLTNSILFFSMEASAGKVYKVYDKGTICGWVTYVIGALLIIAAAYAIFTSIKMMRDEIKHPQTSKGTTYNYLKK